MDLPMRGMAMRVVRRRNAVCAGRCGDGVRQVIRRPGSRPRRPTARRHGLHSDFPLRRSANRRRASFSGARAARRSAAGEREHRAGRQAGARDPARASTRTTATRGPGRCFPGQIADVAVYKNAAYLNSWAESTCRRGGFFSVDISDPANPKQLAFVPALPGTYHGEGAHVITLNIPGGFQGDVLAVNNEPCAAHGSGGFDLYDVSNPANPVTLVQGVRRPVGRPRAGQSRSGR